MNQEIRKGGLGRGLAALIPSGPAPSTLKFGEGPKLGAVPKPEDSPKPADDAKAEETPKHPDRDAHEDRAEGAKRSHSAKMRDDGPRLGDSAADVILGGTRGARGQEKLRSVPGAPAPEAVRGTVRERGQKVAEKPPVDVGATYREIPIAEIVPNPQQPRHTFDEEALAELVHSIREFGLMQPIVVRQAETGYELIMGERRWRAAGRAGLKTIPAIVRDTDDGAMLRDALLENIHRVQLNPLEEAAAYQQLLEEFDVTQAELAGRLGRSRPVITNTIRLLALPVPVQRRVAAGVLSAGHARALLGLKLGEHTSEAQEELAGRIIAEGLSVRATEEAVTLLNRGEGAPERKPVEPAPQPEMLTRAADRLGDVWDTKVTVTMGKRKGRMVVEFGDPEDFERILSLIEGRDD
ncbi:ParB/RepB/Spo0J family partition protein [Corynebacterium lemuris]|uniref:ParB/RepB/Spo0J family partition protein n=1 Tax=Corynebacterium lemuris TaxID=1859292 RepID=UPI003F6F4AF9